MLNPGDTSGEMLPSTKPAVGEINSPTTSSPAEGESSPSSSTTSSSASAESASNSKSSAKEDRANLSRRQKKNRTKIPKEQPRDEYEPAQQQQGRHRRVYQLQYFNSFSTSPVFDSSTPEITTTTESMIFDYNQPWYTITGDVAWSTNTGLQRYGPRSDHCKKYVSDERERLGHVTDAFITEALRKYFLNPEQRSREGYPFQCDYYGGYVVILNFRRRPFGLRYNNTPHRNLDANAREFVPGNGQQMESEADSGNYGSSSRSSTSSVESLDLEQESALDSDKNSDVGESSSSSTESSASSGTGYLEGKSRRNSTPEPPSLNTGERQCNRCYKRFYVNQENEYLQEEECVHHWGKYRNCVYIGAPLIMWDCCRAKEEDAAGCTIAKMHVWTGLHYGFNGPLKGYVRTQPCETIPCDGNYGVYALDCEMCFTRRGMELAKVTVIAVDGSVVYDTLVKPELEIIDYNTRFSGIRPADLLKVTKTVQDVQNDLIQFIYAETILIGHGLANDLRVLRIIHSTVIDTSVAYPHYLGYPYQWSLKALARNILQREIQTGEHDSSEDASAAMDLMLKKVHQDFSNLK